MIDTTSDPGIHRDQTPRKHSIFVGRNQFGAYCMVCQQPLSQEEDEWDACDTCGGEGVAAITDAALRFDDVEVGRGE